MNHTETGHELRYFLRVISCYTSSGTRRVALVKNPVVRRKWGEDGTAFMTNAT